MKGSFSMILKSQIDQSSIPNEISHLTLDEIVDFTNQYYATTPVKTLLSKFKINTKSVHNILPFLKSDAKCRYCEAEMLKILPPKTSLSDPKYKQLHLCTNCKHQDNSMKCLDCGCDSCLLDRFGLGSNFTSKNFDSTSLHPELSHLTADEMIDLLRQYYLNVKYSDLTKNFNLECSNPYKFFPTLIVDACCRLCKGTITTKVPPRSQLINPNEFYASYDCATCNLSEDSNASNFPLMNHISQFNEIFNAQKVVDSESTMSKQKSETLSTAQVPTIPAKVKESDLSLQEKVFLAAILNATFNYQTNMIEPFIYSIRPIAAIPEYEYAIIDHLLQRGIIIPLDPTIEIENKELMYHIPYQLNIESTLQNESLTNMVNRLKNPTLNFTDEEIKIMFNLWKKVSLSEILDELYMLLRRSEFPNDITPSTLKLFEQLLNKLAPSQVLTIIYRSFAHSALEYILKFISFQDTTKVFLQSIEYLIIKSEKEQYSYKKRSRNRQNFKSYLTEIVESKLLKINSSDHFNSSLVIKNF